MNDPVCLQRAYEHSKLNRRFMSQGTVCRCFHCLGEFPAERISHWTDQGETALCPVCGVDAVLSSQADPLSETLIGQLRHTYFGTPSKKYTNDEWQAALAAERERRDATVSDP